eukprot:2930068-Prymnesium_polylepis.1
MLLREKPRVPLRIRAQSCRDVRAARLLQRKRFSCLGVNRMAIDVSTALVFASREILPKTPPPS